MGSNKGAKIISDLVGVYTVLVIADLGLTPLAASASGADVWYCIIRVLPLTGCPILEHVGRTDKQCATLLRLLKLLATGRQFAQAAQLLPPTGCLHDIELVQQPNKHSLG